MSEKEGCSEEENEKGGRREIERGVGESGKEKKKRGRERENKDEERMERVERECKDSKVRKIIL